MSRKKPRSTKKPKLPRAPLPRQRHAVHEVKSKRPFRKVKHRKPPSTEEE